MVASLMTTRVKRLEDLMAELTSNVNRLSIEMREFQHKTDRVIAEMQASQRKTDEMIAEMRASHAEMQASQRKADEMIAEMRASQRKADETIAEMRLQYRQHNEKMAEISASTGRMVEDLVAPSVFTFFKIFANDPDPLLWGIRSIRKFEGRTKEFDVVLVTNTYLLINETKKVLRPKDITKFARNLPEARHYFPEYADRKIIGSMATLWIDDSVLRLGERQGLLMLGMTDGLLKVLNTPEFEPIFF